MGTSANNTGGTGGGWTTFKRNATSFAQHGGQARLAKTLGGFVAAMGGAAAGAAGATAGTQTGQSLGSFLAAATGPQGLAGGLEAVGLESLVGQDRFTVLSELLYVLGGSGSAVEQQAARDALLDVLDDLLPEGDDVALEAVQLDEAGVRDALCRYIAALVYNLAIPVIEVRLEALQDQALIQSRDRELHDYIDALVRLKMQTVSVLTVDWKSADGKEFVQGVLQAVYEQLEADA
jgi:hypothetical protein